MRLPWQRKNTKANVSKLVMNEAPDPAVSGSDYLHYQLRTMQFRLSAPIWSIMSGPNYLFDMYTLPDELLLLNIMRNVYEYGRRHWTWVAAAGAAATQAFHSSTAQWIDSQDFLVANALKMGRGLLDGTTDCGACGNFNTAFQFIAARLFNIKLKGGSEVGVTQIKGDFITMPGTQVIDSHWLGNVRTDAISNEVLRAFDFNNHWFCNYQGRIYDTTCNRTFRSTDEMIWCRLEKVSPEIQARFKGGQNTSVYLVHPVNKTFHSGSPGVTQKMIVPPKYCVKIGQENLSGGSGGFSNWLLTDYTEIPEVLMRKLALRSSRG